MCTPSADLSCFPTGSQDCCSGGDVPLARQNKRTAQIRQPHIAVGSEVLITVSKAT